MAIFRKRFLAGVAGVLATAQRARAASFEFKCGSNLALDHPTTAPLSQMWKAVERESGGRVRTQFFPNAVLGSDISMLTQLRVGALQFMLNSPPSLGSVIPVADISFLGFAFKNEDETLHVMDGPLGAYVRAEAIARGMILLPGMWSTGINHVGSNSRPIRTPDDFHGFKMKVTGRLATDLFKNLGATSVVMSLPETYTALQTNVLDGEDTTLATLEASRFFEVNKHVSLTGHGSSGEWLVANADAWKALPPDLQAIIERNCLKTSLAERRSSKVLQKALYDKLQRQGLTFNQIDQAACRARLDQYYETWAAVFGPTAMGLLQGSLGRKI